MVFMDTAATIPHRGLRSAANFWLFAFYGLFISMIIYPVYGTVWAMRTAPTYGCGPVALRYPRGEGVGVPMPRTITPIEIGRGEDLREGDRVAVVGYGSGVQKASGSPSEGWNFTSRWPTRASPSRSTRTC